ncbi:hypothetical protein SPRG_10345 [Saprolegnia parasitica CBS 223.65]|uniref:EF-hand domain-containing protein n=1 Tax=Saprolegnia parasitica (strain CBS 223.65) TaxID=695850 RepID=A0A067C5U9_SAPPC|nr:hypothetical protein SPRG_10345 [Saprolegnia parasitica CBS 223.65]KDO24530.1 hypothetical protein SPRG_10345 [Saprolegnia parasitica CBS 223.65]|eukprot:XP_012204792.1 hypothetical protein SPRG_10345 [Saprolegnia parasitica CBS 223.65]
MLLRPGPTMQPNESDEKAVSLYRPPQATIAPLDTLGPLPPSWFRRLDKYIHANGLRAIDVFAAMDLNQNKRISLDELLDGLHQINFDVSDDDVADLGRWMASLDDDGVTFKEFTLALKLRASKTSPPKNQQQRSLSNGAKKLLAPS